ncbi:MarR family winged helix-turn-helix transcriptional regulator [Aquitalea denitrificans]|uniref:MarR family winged helix-turn-helix transcriptional regulator n=1 Tax=Aquitalea denitrificans TaxID=519081 RepID=UPI001359681E|nr:MarR family winged helix-turn-helix transcriptional regulator [Aquitalea denitrificans]
MKKPDTPKVSELESHLGFWLRFVSNQVSSRFENLLAKHEISVAEWVAMRSLYGRADSTHADLISALGMTKGAASKVISKLEAKGLAERQLSKDSQRAQVLCLTESGLAMVPKLAVIADENDAHFFSHMSDTQRQSLATLMRELVEHHQLTQLPTR